MFRHKDHNLLQDAETKGGVFYYFTINYIPYCIYVFLDKSNTQLLFYLYRHNYIYNGYILKNIKY